MTRKYRIILSFVLCVLLTAVFPAAAESYTDGVQLLDLVFKGTDVWTLTPQNMDVLLNRSDLKCRWSVNSSVFMCQPNMKNLIGSYTLKFRFPNRNQLRTVELLIKHPEIEQKLKSLGNSDSAEYYVSYVLEQEFKNREYVTEWETRSDLMIKDGTYITQNVEESSHYTIGNAVLSTGFIKERDGTTAVLSVMELNAYSALQNTHTRYDAELGREIIIVVQDTEIVTD